MTEFSKLKDKLLKIAGLRVVGTEDPQASELIKNGRIFPKRVKHIKGEQHFCHINASLKYIGHYAYGYKDICNLVTGYVLHYDTAIWTQHSWIWDGKWILETVPDFDVKKYFGVILEGFEATKFACSQTMMKLPGFPR